MSSVEQAMPFLSDLLIASIPSKLKQETSISETIDVQQAQRVTRGIRFKNCDFKPALILTGLGASLL